MQNVVVRIQPTATDVWLLYDEITGGTPETSTVFAVNNLGSATLFGNVISMGPGATNSYGAAVQNYGEMRLSANVLNPGDQGANMGASYGLINLVANGTSKGTAYAVNNVIYAGRGKARSRGVFSGSPLTLVNNVIGDRTEIAVDWSKRPQNNAIPLDVGFASKTWLRNNVFSQMIYSDEPSPPNALANRHLFVHSAQSATYVDDIAIVNTCTWTGCQSTGGNLPSGSALINAGTPTTTWITGGLGHLSVDEKLRPLGGAWDIGINEGP